jgi:3-oxoacyl-(acyl-carrier-protein) synthase
MMTTPLPGGSGERDDAVVISGLAPLTAIGSGAATYWAALVAGTSGLSKITRFDTETFPVKVAAEVHDVDLAAAVDRRLAVATDRWTQFGLAATELALADGQVDLAAFDPYGVAVITASGSGGNEFGQREIAALWTRGPKAVSVYQSIAWFYAATTGQLSIRHGSKGMCGVLVEGAAGGLDAFAQAARALRSGTDLALVGATEAPLSPYALTCVLGSGLLSTASDPATAYRPFGAGAAGYVTGEGGAMFTVERASSCRDRGVAPHAVVAGHAATHDGRRHRSADPEIAAAGLAEAITAALARAGAASGDVDVVFADGAGAGDLDQAEVTALRLALGAHGATVPVTVPKAATGRMEAASAALDVAAAVLALEHQVVPPTATTGPLAATAEIDLVRTARPASLGTALVLARGHGGFNSALVLQRPSHPSPTTTHEENPNP